MNLESIFTQAVSMPTLAEMDIEAATEKYIRDVVEPWRVNIQVTFDEEGETVEVSIESKSKDHPVKRAYAFPMTRKAIEYNDLHVFRGQLLRLQARIASHGDTFLSDEGMRLLGKSVVQSNRRNRSHKETA